MALPTNNSRSTRRDAALDGLRGLAILFVFFFHYGGGLHSHSRIVRSIGLLTESGWIGVVLFFSLSGFLITGSLWDSLSAAHPAQPDPAQPPSTAPRTAPPLPSNLRILRNFYARRALRILPLYYGVIVFCALSAFSRGAPLLDPTFNIFFFFLQDLPFIAAHALVTASPFPLYHLWSLAVEEQFYLFWPFLLLLVDSHPARPRRYAIRASLWVFALSVVFCLLVYGLPLFASIRQEKVLDSFLLTHLGALALGGALAFALRSSRPGRASSSSRFVYRYAPIAFAASLLLFCVSSFFARSFYLTAPIQFMLGLPAISIATTALIPIVLRPGLPRTLISLAPLGWLGRISYGFYIFHILLQPIFDSLGAHLAHAGSGSMYQLARMLVAFPISVLVAWLSFHLLEVPFLRRQRKFPMKPAVPRTPHLH